LTDDGPTLLGLYVVLAGLVAALIVIAIGVFRLVVRSKALKKRIDEVAKLPFLPTLELTSARLDIATRRIDSLPLLEARARRAVAEIQAARAQLDAAALTVRDAVRFVVMGR
jgi:hypothetical protein